MLSNTTILNHYTRLIIAFILLLTYSLLSSCKQEEASATRTQSWKTDRSLDDLTEPEQDALLLEVYEQSLKLRNTPENRSYLDSVATLFNDYEKEDYYIKTASKLIAFAKADRDSLVLGSIYSNLAIHYENTSQFDSSFSYFDKAERLYTQLGNTKRSAEMIIGKASILYDFGIYIESESEAIRAINVKQPLENLPIQYETYQLLGLILTELHEYDTALNYFQKTGEILHQIERRNIFKPTEVPEAYAALYNNIAGVFELKKQFKESIAYYDKALNLKQINEINPLLLAALINNRARSHIQLGNTKHILDELQKSLEIRKTFGHPHYLNMSYLTFGDYYVLQQDTLTALRYIQKAFENAQAIDNLIDEKEALQQFIKLDKKNLQCYNESYITLSEKIRNRDRLAQNKFARIAYETEQIENQMVQLRKRNRNTVTIIILVVALVFSVFGLQARNKRIRFESEKKLADQKFYELMSQQHEKQEHAKEEERQRIARELHDGVVNRVFTTRFNLMQLPSEMTEHKELLVQELEQAEQDIRAVSHRLIREFDFNHTPFKNLIADLVQIQKNQDQTQFTLSTDSGINWNGLTLNQKAQLYRILQELLQNVNKYAQAHHCQVWFLKEGDTLKVKVLDDGIGFDSRKGASGIGLQNVKSRVASIRGTVTITSRSGLGTEIEISLPLNPDTPNELY